MLRGAGCGWRDGSRCSVVVDQILEFLAGLEVWDTLGGYFHLFSGLWIPADACVPLANSKTAEPSNFEFVAGLECLDYTFEHGVDDDFRILPRQLRNLGHF